MFKKVRKKFNFLFKLNDLFDRKEKFQLMIVLAASLFMAVFQAMGIASILPFINMVMDPSVVKENEWLNYFFNFLNFESVSSFIVFSGFAVLSLLISGNLVSIFATWLRINFAWRKNHKLSNALLKKYLSMPYAFFLNQNTSELVKNVVAEVRQLTNSFILPLIKIITDGIVIVVIVVMLLYVNLLMTLVAAGILISAYCFIYIYFSDRLKTGGKKRLKENKERYKAATEALSGAKDIKILNVENFFLDRFNIHSDLFSSLQAWYQVIGQVPRYIMEIVAFGGIVGMLTFLVSSNISVDKIIPLVSFFAFAGYRLMPALQSVFNSFTTFRFNKVVLDKIHMDMTAQGVATKNFSPKKSKIKPLPFDDRILLENICFSYPGNSKPSLTDINISISKNAFIAFIGTTGSGKTTLVDLILGLLVPDKGAIRIDNVEINEKNVSRWQASIGYVPQQIYLSDDSIARNIAFGIPDEKIDMRQVTKVTKMSNLHNFIDTELSDGYDTVIGERGIRLSGGQRQRIGIARALYHDPQVLIFDEATSSLDNATEKEVLKAINEVAKSKTMMVIAHRLTTVKNCDHVYLIKKGVVVADGSYDDLINNNISK